MIDSSSQLSSVRKVHVMTINSRSRAHNSAVARILQTSYSNRDVENTGIKNLLDRQKSIEIPVHS